MIKVINTSKNRVWVNIGILFFFFFSNRKVKTKNLHLISDAQSGTGSILRKKGICTKNSFKDGREEGKNDRNNAPRVSGRHCGGCL